MKKILKELEGLKKTLITPSSEAAFKKVGKAIEEYAKDADSYDDTEAKYDNTINAGIGFIHWSSDNLQLQAIMEAIEEKLKKKSPNDIAAHIQAF